jgi:hypothetical protein
MKSSTARTARKPKKAAAPKKKAVRAPRAAPKRVKAKGPLEIPLSFAALAAAFAKDRRVALERGWGADNVVLKLDAKIFIMFSRGQLVTKLPKKRVDELILAGQGKRFDPRRDGRLMKEWLVVTTDEATWVGVAHEAYQFVKASR